MTENLLKELVREKLPSGAHITSVGVDVKMTGRDFYVKYTLPNSIKVRRKGLKEAEVLAAMFHSLLLGDE